jgi:hypothetical protein
MSPSFPLGGTRLPSIVLSLQYPDGHLQLLAAIDQSPALGDEQLFGVGRTEIVTLPVRMVDARLPMDSGTLV